MSKLLDDLRVTGVSITDGTYTVPRINVAAALTRSDHVPPTAPGSVVATSSGTSQVDLSWTAATDNYGVDHYEIERSTSVLGPFSPIGSVSGTTFSDTVGLITNTTYLYRVRAVDTSNNKSAYATDFTTTTIFTDDPLVVLSTPVRAIHIYELRTAVNAVRTCAQLSAASWTDSILQGAIVRTVHVQELRDRLAEARGQLGASAITYTDPTLSPAVTVIRSVHIGELRTAVR